MKYFEKTAVGPVISITKDPTKSFGGYYMPASMIKKFDASEDFASLIPKIMLNKRFNKEQRISGCPC